MKAFHVSRVQFDFKNEMSDGARVLAKALADGTHTIPVPVTALSKLKAGRGILPTGVLGLDHILRGGFPCCSLRSPENGRVCA